MEKNTSGGQHTRGPLCTLQNHFAIGGVKTMMSSPSVVRETRGTASTVSNHARTSAVNVLQKIAGGNQNCRSTMFDATPHAVHLAVRPLLRFFERKTNKGENVERRIPTWKGEGCTLQCSLSCAFVRRTNDVERRIPTLGDTGSHS